jgi:hypothetical protein
MQFLSRLILLACLASTVHAHEMDDAALPEGRGLRATTAVALSHARSDVAWPHARLDGVLSSGRTPNDRRGNALEHGVVAVAVKPIDALSAQVAWGWHDKDPAHLETAWVQGTWSTTDGDDRWLAGAGRRRLPTGPVIAQGGHFDRFASVPLAKRAVLDDDWIDDSAAVTWQNQRDHEAGAIARFESATLSLWQPRTFPGSRDTKAVPALHVGMRLWSLRLDAFGLSTQPRGRGAYVQNELAAHTHDTPDCNNSLVGIHCFDGRTDVAGLSASWVTPLPGLQLQAAGLLRRDRGELTSINGVAQYRGSTAGFWVDAAWQFLRRWSVAARWEGLRGRQTLTGDGATLVATDAGLLNNQRHQRLSTALTFAPVNALRISTEFGQELHGTERDPFALVRLVWTPDTLLDLSW